MTAIAISSPCVLRKFTVLWLVSAPFSMFAVKKVVRNPHNFAEAKKGISWPVISGQ
jgi:hypothetical protein